MTRFSADWHARREIEVAARENADMNANCDFVDITGMGVSRIPAPESRGVESPASRKHGEAVPGLIAPPAAAPSKFRNVATNGYHSKRESNRAADLKLLEKSGQIRNLREQVKYLLIPRQDGERECSYVADFVYELRGFTTDFGTIWNWTVEDCKGFRTPDYVIKRKLMLFVHGVKVRET